jgi:hypothetical protein
MPSTYSDQKGSKMKTPGHLWAPDHPLEAFTMKVNFEREGLMLLTSTGRSSTCRKDLWRYREEFSYPLDQLKAADVVHHLALAVIQDRPRTDALLHQALRGGSAFEDVPLPF